MKKLMISLISLSTFSYAQLLPTGTSTTDNKFRSGGLAIGFTTLPSTTSWSGNTGLILNRSLNFGLYNYSNFGDFDIRTYKGMVIKKTNPLIAPTGFGGIRLENHNNTRSVILNIAEDNTNGLLSGVAVAGDVVLASRTNTNFIISNENIGNIKFALGQDSFIGGVGSTNPNPVLTRMTILNNGRVGIGTETPTELLAVNGTIHAKEVRVDLVGWPDYVFE
jgi:hypothetical protein